MKKRWWLVLCLLAVPASLGELSTHPTEQDGQVVLNYPSQVSLEEPFGIIITYYRVNQLVEAARVRLTRAGQEVFGADATSSAALRATLTESESGRIQYLLLVDEQLPGDIVTTTSIPFTIQTVGSELEHMTTAHEAVVVSGSNELFFDDLSAYEPFSARGGFTYSVTRKNPHEVDCTLSGTQIEFHAVPEYLGESICQVTGKVLNTSIVHTYTLHVVPDKKVIMKDLPDIRILKGAAASTIIAENFTRFCQYEIPSGLSPLIFFRTAYPLFELAREGSNLVLVSLDPEWTGEENIRIGCHTQAQTFRLIVGRRLLEEGAPLNVTEDAAPDRYHVAFGAGELTVTAPPVVTLPDAPPLVAALTLAEITGLASNLTLSWPPNQSHTVPCTTNPCQLSLPLFRPFPGLTDYTLTAELELPQAIEMDKPLASGHLLAHEGMLLLRVLRPISFVASEGTDSPAAGLDPNLGVLRSLEGGAATAALRLAKLANRTPDFEALSSQVDGAHQRANITKRLETMHRTDALGRARDVTRVTLRIEPRSPTTLVLIEYVPKHAAPTAGHLAFDETAPAPTVLLLDPVLQWTLPNLNAPSELWYELPGTTNETGVTLPLLVKGPPIVARTTLLAILGAAAFALLWWSGFAAIKRARTIRSHAAPLLPTSSAQPGDAARAAPLEIAIEEEDVLTELFHYVRAMRDAGASRNTIKSKLLEAQWPSDVAEAILAQTEKSG